eukprot:7021346-Prymnesium_polylepis.1
MFVSPGREPRQGDRHQRRQQLEQGGSLFVGMAEQAPHEGGRAPLCRWSAHLQQPQAGEAELEFAGGKPQSCQLVGRQVESPVSAFV